MGGSENRMIVKGEIKSISSIDRGHLKFNSNDEWIGRYMKTEIYPNFFFFSPFALFIIILTSFYLKIFNENLLTIISFNILLLLIPLVSILIIKKRIKQTIIPGLYSKGIQHPDGYFIPFDEIRWIEETTGRDFLLKKAYVLIILVFPIDQNVFIPISSSFLGVESIEYLISKKSKGEMLHIYRSEENQRVAPLEKNRAETPNPTELNSKR